MTEDRTQKTESSPPSSEAAVMPPAAPGMTGPPDAAGVAASADAAPEKASSAKTSAATSPSPAKAAPPKKAPPPPNPWVEAAKAKAEELAQALASQLPNGWLEEVGAVHHQPMLRVRKQHFPAVFRAAHALPSWELDYLVCYTATDYKEHLEVVAYVESTKFGHMVCIKTRTEREAASVPSIVSVHPGANWEEREMFDLFGIEFTGHPDLRRIMMWDEYVGHPLRKDFVDPSLTEEVNRDGADS
ncbi:MAG: NADH-quinone oxidoreductase subunit C [Alicyclobacillaceae bacterium]|nr:NADH-quinone oxidoreductase subunit C [Alicyclobacillaceae bacterium]